MPGSLGDLEGQRVSPSQSCGASLASTSAQVSTAHSDGRGPSAFLSSQDSTVSWSNRSQALPPHALSTPVSVPFLPFTVAGTDGACRQFCSGSYDGASMTAESVEGEDKSASSTFRSKAEALFDAIRTDPSKLISVPVVEGSLSESARLLGEEAVSESLPKLAESSLMKHLFEEFHKNFSKRADADGAPPAEDLALSSAPRVLKLEQALKVKRVPHLVKRKILLNHSSIPPASITPSADDLSASQGPPDTKVHRFPS